LDAEVFDPPLDAGVAHIVAALRAGGVETYESCEGGTGHAFTQPTVRFHGEQSAGWHALHVAREVGLRVEELRRAWMVVNGEPLGPFWEMTFRVHAD
jgi:hypothetical protein